MNPLLLALSAMAQDPDPRLWLEEVEGEQALEWVKARNAEAVGAFGEDDEVKAMQARLLDIYNASDKIPYVSKRGDLYYNFWTDAEHERGVWRTTTLESYASDEPAWDVLLDIDALNEAEGENWVYKGVTCLPPEYRRCLLSLSRGGADATVVREFDTVDKQFVEGGFQLPENKQRVSWIDEDTIFVATDFGEGMTDSGYPRQVRLWRRGTPLAEAEAVYEGQQSDISVGAYTDLTPGWERQFVYRGVTFYTNEMWERKKGKLIKIEKPDDVDVEIHHDHIVFQLRKDWEHDGTTYKAGSLLASSYKKWMKGKGELVELFVPSDTTSLQSFGFTKNGLYLNILDDVKSRVEVLWPDDGWRREPLKGVPAFGDLDVSAVDPWESDDVWITVADYLTPTSLMLGSLGAESHRALKESPSYFDANGLTVSQHFATSDDGTRVPYFQVGPADIPEGGVPTLLYGYGGFEVSLLPSYSGTIGVAWLEKGGVYVVANIRGGGEYGPRWHQAALKENRHKAYEDFAAVARDLVARGVTTKEQLGARGGSNGGLLMGNMYTQYPELFGAIQCAVPLLDMKRYTKLLAGASWAGEYGDPDDPEQWAFIQTFSPYHNIVADKDYPPILFTTSTRDDRVHPGHARKMAHALLEAGKDVAYYENIEGGHGGAADNKQAAFMSALGYHYLWEQLTKPADEEPSDEPTGE